LQPVIRIDPKHYNDLVFVDFDSFNQGTDNFTLGGEIDGAQAVIDRRSKLFEPVDHQE
jgi:hypothetical protein